MTGGFTGPRRPAIVGYAHSPVARTADRSLGALTVNVVRDAIADAGLELADVDGFSTGAAFPAAGAHTPTDGVELVSTDWLIDHLRVEPRWFAGFQGIGQISGSVILAATALASGAADVVVVHRSLYNPPRSYHGNAMEVARGRDQWTAPHGLWGPPMHMALTYREYLERYQVDREAMAPVVAGSRRAGSLLPWSAWFGRPLSEQEYLEARMIADPISLLDCDLPVTGAAAFVMTTAERAADLPHRPVYVAGFAQGRRRARNGVTIWSLDEIERGGANLAQRLWQSCGFGPTELDVPQVYDGFSPMVYFWLEALGLCGPGEAAAYLASSDASAGLPCATGGGALGNGRMHGVPQMLESYLQLAGRAGHRQLARAETAVACQAAPDCGGAVAYTI